MILKLNYKDKIFISIVLLVHVVFFAMALSFKRIYMGDSFEYIYEALNIKQYFFFYSGNPALPIQPEYLTQRQPLYPLFLLGVYLFSVNNWVVIVLQNMLSVFNIMYCRKMLTRLGYDAKYDWLLLLLVIGYPSQFINADTIAPDILLQTFVLLYAGSFVRWWQERRLAYAAYMSLCLIAGMLVKPVLYPFVYAHIVIVIATARYLKVNMQRPVLAAIAPLCAMMLYSYSNYLRTGKFHFTSNKAFNAVYYYYEFFGHAKGQDYAVKFLSDERALMNAIPDYGTRYDYANERGMDLLRQNFVPYMAYHLENSARIFVEPGKAEIDLFTGKLTYGGLYDKGNKQGFYASWRDRGMAGLSDYMRHNGSLPVVLVVFLFNCIRFIGLVVFFTRRNIPPGIRLFLLIFIGYFAVAAGPIANTRYFLPVSLIAIACSVTGYMSILGSRRQAI